MCLPIFSVFLSSHLLPPPPPFLSLGPFPRNLSINLAWQFLLTWQSQNTHTLLQGGSEIPRAHSWRPRWELPDFLWQAPQIGVILCWSPKPAQIQCRGVWLIRRHLWRPVTIVTNFTNEETDTLRVRIFLVGYALKDFNSESVFLVLERTLEKRYLFRYYFMWILGVWRRWYWKSFPLLSPIKAFGFRWWEWEWEGQE